MQVQHVFLVGAKFLGNYCGYETFIDKLIEYHQNNNELKYHVVCKANGDGCMNPYKTAGAKIISDHEFIYHNADCFRISIPQKLGSAQVVCYDVAALKECLNIIKKQNIKSPIIYIMVCCIGSFIKFFYKKIHKLGGRIFLNPDGHEWIRAKWSALVRKYWKWSEQNMIKYCDLAICTSVNIEKYIHKCYDGKGINRKNPKTTFFLLKII